MPFFTRSAQIQLHGGIATEAFQLNFVDFSCCSVSCRYLTHYLELITKEIKTRLQFE